MTMIISIIFLNIKIDIIMNEYFLNFNSFLLKSLILIVTRIMAISGLYKYINNR